jgi:hypothetical protein
LKEIIVRSKSYFIGNEPEKGMAQFGASNLEV